MAVNEVLSGRYNAILHKLLSMKEGAPAPTLAPEILPVIVLEDDRPEWAFLAGERLLSVSHQQAGGVGLAPFLALTNPVGSGVILVIEQVIFSVQGGSSSLSLPPEWSVGAYEGTPTSGADIAAGETRDLRNPRPGPGILRAGSTASGFPAGITLAQPGLVRGTGGTGFTTPAADVQLRVPWILAENTGVLISSLPVGANTEIRGGFIYRARFQEPSEAR